MFYNEKNNLEFIEIVFENMEVYRLYKDMIVNLSLFDLKMDMCFDLINNDSCMEKKVYAKRLSLNINSKGLNQKEFYRNDKEKSKKLKDRLNGYDITSLDIFFEDKKQMTVFVEWETDGEFDAVNKHMKLKVTDDYAFIDFI